MLIKDILTQSDGVSYDVMRVIPVAAALVYFALSVYNASDFDPIDFATGIAILLGGAGTSIGVRGLLEDPKPENNG